MYNEEFDGLKAAFSPQETEPSPADLQAYSAIDLCNIATNYFIKGEHKPAAYWYHLALKIDPGLAVPYMNLASIFSSVGLKEEANACREQAYRLQRVFIEQEGTPVRRVLILSVGQTSGNVPVEALLPITRNCRIQYIIDYAADNEDAQLPSYDLVFNAIGEPDVAFPLADRLKEFVDKCRRPILNPPVAIIRTHRHQMSTLLGDISGVALAPCIRFENSPTSREELAEAIETGCLTFPVLLRPVAAHGGNGLVCCESREELENRLGTADGAQYLTAYCDYRSADGYYRKYRVIFIDRKPFPYHLAISSHWMVHYFSADMEENRWKIEEERRFLEDAATVLGTAAMAAIADIGHCLDLDYGGIDFTILPDGRVFVFEANATMLVHKEPAVSPVVYKNAQVERIAKAFDEMLEKRVLQTS